MSDFWKDYEPEPHKGLSEHLAQVTNGRVRIDPVTGDVGIGTPPPQPAPVQSAERGEPVAFFCPSQGFYWAKPTKIIAPVTVDVKPLPLYTTPPAQPAPVQEPVAWVCYGAPGKRDIDFEEADINKLPIGTQLYTTPSAAKRQWTGLTDEEMQTLWDRYAHMEMMRAIEAKLKEKNNG